MITPTLPEIITSQIETESSQKSIKKTKMLICRNKDKCTDGLKNRIDFVKVIFK